MFDTVSFLLKGQKFINDYGEKVKGKKIVLISGGHFPITKMIQSNFLISKSSIKQGLF